MELRMTFSDGVSSRTISIRYLVMNAPSVCNILLGKPALKAHEDETALSRTGCNCF